MKRGGGCPALANAERLAWLNDPKRRIAALDHAAEQKALGAVRVDALQIHQLPGIGQRHQQHVTTLAQGIGADCLCTQVGVIGIGAASITPETIGIFGSVLLTLVLLGLPLATGLLDALAQQIRFLGVGGLAAAPCVRCADFPTAKTAGRDAVSEQQIPAVEGTGLVAWHAEAVDAAVWFWQPIQRSEHAL